MVTDVITKFTYLEHGKKAPTHSGFKGIISTKSIIGFSHYESRKASRKLSEDAKAVVTANKNFFKYTKERMGATATYSSLGWLDNDEKDLEFRKEIAKYFHTDGDLLWVPVISLKDFMTSTEMKLFNEKDYAAVFDKILPSWFQQAGFKNDNMMWWLDHHVNTDNPHIHLNFFEKDKTKTIGKLPMKDINNFKSMFWKEVFSKKRYLQEVGKTVEAGFKNKDILKQETYKSFKEEMKNCTEPEFIKKLQDLYHKLPSSGRLQYNSSHMIPFRSDLDQLVDILLRTETVNKKYSQFTKSVNEFDEVRSKSLNTKYTSMAKSEDNKLRVLLANSVLQEFKSINREFWEGQIKSNKNSTGEKIMIPIANSLIMNKATDKFLVRVPGGGDHIYINKRNCTLVSMDKNIYVAEITDKEKFEVYDQQGNRKNEELSFEKIKESFSDGQSHMDSLLEKNQTDKAALWQYRQKEWARSQHDWNHSSEKMKKASFAWMNEIEQEVEQARNEFLEGREYL